MAKRADGMYAGTIGGTGLSIPRQTGKTFLVAAIMFALCLARPGFTVLWTAHRLRTAEETFGKLQVFAKRRRIAPHVKQITTGSGEQRIIFRNGSRILFGARERGFGRGFDEVDALVFDEAQHLTDSALDDMVPATNQSRQPEGALMLFLGTPPRPQDPGEVFARMREDARNEDEDTGWVEFGADPEFLPTPLPEPLSDADWGQITSANPSFPEDTSRTAILRMRKKLGDDSFLREGLGIWGRSILSLMLDPADWSLLSVGSQAPITPVLSVEVFGDVATVGSAWTVDGKPHVEVFEDVARTELVEALLRHRATYGVQMVVVDRGEYAQAASLIPSIETAGFVVPVFGSAERVQACASLCDLVTAGGLSHNGDPAVLAAIDAMKPKETPGGRVFSRRSSDGDIGALYAVTLALHGLVNGPSREFWGAIG